MDKKKNIKVVKAFKKIVSEKIKIKKIILFGSRARGDFRKDSDFDLIVVSDEFDGVRSYKRAPDMYRAWDANYSVDFVCLTSEEFEGMKDKPTIINLAIKEGIEI
ncbi:nucleotidyltransferase domain-containing protein [Candidatus Pacearchaeota archaeon]|nr:nucleotidyltransferase domain-containing protein [Candidatus Pacearchaeota archaeon]